MTIAFEFGVAEGELIDTQRRLETPTPQLFEATKLLSSGRRRGRYRPGDGVLIKAGAAARETLTDFARAATARIVHQPAVDALMHRLDPLAAGRHDGQSRHRSPRVRRLRAATLRRCARGAGVC